MVRRRATLSFLIPENSSGTGNLIAPFAGWKAPSRLGGNQIRKVCAVSQRLGLKPEEVKVELVAL